MCKVQPVRGTKDLLPDEYDKFERIQRVAQDVGVRYGFQPVQTPIFEFQEVFSKTLGEASDIIGKEMYSFADRGGSILTLRPEFTAAQVRMLISSKINPLVKFYTSGPVFRYERPQKCRQRQFHQINYENFGMAHPEADVEMIALAYTILRELNIHDRTVLEINSLGCEKSMQEYKSRLVLYLTKYAQDLSEDSRKRLNTNPLRILDSKDSCDAEVLNSAPKISDYYEADAAKFFDRVLQCLTALDIPYRVNHNLVRGLDYYNGTVFEFKTTELGSQDAVMAGGRYDNLVAMMGGQDVAAIGFAGGIERIAALVEHSKTDRFCVAITPICEEAINYVVRLAYDLRNVGVKIACDYKVVKLKTCFKRLETIGAHVAIIIGEDELSKGTVACRDMKTREQREISVDSIKDYISNLVKEHSLQ